MLKVKNPYLAVALIVAVAIIIAVTAPWESDSNQILVSVKKGNFTGKIYVSGQLQAQNSVSIEAPREIASPFLRLDDIKITSLVEEGTAVDSGDFVASLDHNAIEELRKTAQEEVDKALGELQDAKTDTSINLSNLRDELLNSELTLEDKKLVAKQSIYESPSVQRQANLDVERSERDLKQKVRNYHLKIKQEQHKIIRAANKFQQQQKKLNSILDLFGALDIKAPAPGIVIYSFDQMGKKIKVGSKISRYNPKIAELPDLNTMISATFINEIDISKIKTGQQVQVGVDAFPSKRFDGEITSVANIGKVIPGSSSKVFEVIVRIDGSDAQLKPGMTSSNQITTQTLKDVLFIPLEALFTQESTSFVYLKQGIGVIKQEVVTGDENENHCIITEGLNEGDQILLNSPANAEQLKLNILEPQADETYSVN